MPPAKRERRDKNNEEETHGGSNDFSVCYQCRLKKIRCGREKPACFNCTRLGHDCEWSDQGKRPNQTALLTQTIFGLGARIEKLEARLAELREELRPPPAQRSDGSPPVCPAASASAAVQQPRVDVATAHAMSDYYHPGLHGTGSSGIDLAWPVDPVTITPNSGISMDWTSPPSGIMDPNNGILIDWNQTPWDLVSPPAMTETGSNSNQGLLGNGHGNGLGNGHGNGQVARSCSDRRPEQYHGPLSLPSLRHDTDELLRKMLDEVRRDRPESVQELESLALARIGLQRLTAEQGTPASAAEEDVGLINTTPLVSLPDLLDAAVGPYFEHVNPLFPVWTEYRFRELMDTSNADRDDAPRCLVRRVSARSLVLLTLTAWSPSQSCGPLGADEIDSSIRSLVAETRGAMTKLELLMSPRLTNVQALVAMETKARVAQIYLGDDHVRRLINCAVFVADSIGLCYPGARARARARAGAGGGADTDADADAEERNGVLWCLSNLTSAVHVTTRHYAHLPAAWGAQDAATAAAAAAAAAAVGAAADHEVRRHRDAKYGLACIAERIRVELLASADAPAPAGEPATALNMQLQSYRWQNYQEGPFPADIAYGETGTIHSPGGSDGARDDPLRVDHQVSFFSTRMLLRWFKSRFGVQDHLGGDQDARRVIGLLLGLWRASPSSAACYTALTGLLVTYPPLFLLNLTTHLLQPSDRPVADQDMQDLQDLLEVSTMLQRVAERATADSGLGQLSRFAWVLTRLVNSSIGARQLRQSIWQWQIPAGGTVESPPVVGSASTSVSNGGSSFADVDAQAFQNYQPFSGDPRNPGR